ncbi:MAG: thioredoxin domain-containing protein [bacterium]|nr:thioredoxin domain-containing protein [bacterium]
MEENSNKKSLKDILPYIQTFLLLVLVIEVTFLLVKPGQDPGRPSRKRKPATPQKLAIDLKEFTKESHFLGNEDAPLTLIKYNSFSCGYCKKARDVVMKLKKKYPNDIKIVYKHFNRGNIDDQASQAVECAGEQEKFWEMYNMLFDRGSRGDIKVYAKELGLDSSSFNSCLASGRYKEKTKRDTEEGQKLGIRGTPSFIVNKSLHVGYRPFSAMEQIVQEELKK